MLEGNVLDVERQLATRAAWLYFVAALTQQQIARRLGITRARVNRLIAEAREQGLVQIRITGRLGACVALEEQLKTRFGLVEASVVPTPPDQSSIPDVIAAAAGDVLSRRLHDGMSVGVGWGRTLRLSLRYLPHRPMPGLSVVSLLGGLTRGAAMNPYETASHLADLLSAQCYYVAAPALTGTAEAREILMAQPMIQEVLERGRSTGIAFLSVGDLSDTSTMVRVGLIGPDEVRSLLEAGAVGDICVHWIDVDGRIVDHPLNQRNMALAPEFLKSIPCVIVASGGTAKIPVLLGALHGGLADVLVTDEDTAAGLLALAGPSTVKSKIALPA